MDWVRGYRGANGGPRRNQLGAFSWFDGVSKSRPLHRAAMRGEVETIRSLCRAGRDPNEKMVEWFDSEPLGWAASFGQLDSVRVLIEFGADPLRPPNKAGLRRCRTLGASATSTSSASSRNTNSELRVFRRPRPARFGDVRPLTRV